MLPGFDFGDTGSFQATVGSPLITPRDGYPLYFAIGQLFLWATGAEPAHALNLASAITAARRLRPRRARRRRVVGIDRGRVRRGAPLRRVVHVLEPGGHRRGLRAAHRAGCADAAAPPAMVEPADHPAAGDLLRRVRARLRQPSLDDPAGARLHAVSAARGAGGMAIAPDAARRRARDRVRAGRRVAVRLEPADALAAARERHAGRRGRRARGGSGSTSPSPTGATRW